MRLVGLDSETQARAKTVHDFFPPEIARLYEADDRKALESGQLGGVGLDVFDIEPLPMDHPLRRFNNAILTSHRGYATIEVMSERYEQAMQNILDYLDANPLALLNPELTPRRN